MNSLTIGVIVILPEEYDAMRLMIENERSYRSEGAGGSHEYLLGNVPSIRSGTHSVAIAQSSGMGNNFAVQRAERMLQDFESMKFIIVCGIAGGVPHPEKPEHHVRLGDIVVSNYKGVIQYDLGKDKGDEFENRTPPRAPSPALSEAVQVLENNQLAGERPWDEYLRLAMEKRNVSVPDASTDVVLDIDGSPVAHPAEDHIRPRIHYGPIGSGNSVQGDFRKRDELRERYGIKAVEMEGSGVADATWISERAGFMIIRGIVDYCDARNKTSQTDVWKRYSAIAAAAYTRSLIESLPGS